MLSITTGSVPWLARLGAQETYIIFLSRKKQLSTAITFHKIFADCGIFVGMICFNFLSMLEHSFVNKNKRYISTGTGIHIFHKMVQLSSSSLRGMKMHSYFVFNISKDQMKGEFAIDD